MASWIDIIALIATLAFIGGAVYGIIRLIQVVNESVASTKESLKSKGLEISGSGVSVKTQKQFNREDYFDATQRGIVRAVNASSFRKGGSETSSPVVSPTGMERTTSSSSGGGSKKKKLFGGGKKD